MAVCFSVQGRLYTDIPFLYQPIYLVRTIYTQISVRPQKEGQRDQACIIFVGICNAKLCSKFWGLSEREAKMQVTFATSAGSGRSLLLQGGNVPNSKPGVIYKCSEYDNYSKDIASLVAKCPKGPTPVNLCLVGKARGGCSTKKTDQFPGADCREQCTAYYWFASLWSSQWLCLSFLNKCWRRWTEMSCR